MRVLVVGCNGQVGRFLESEIRAYPWEVKTLDRAALDITLVSKVTEQVVAFQPDVIINAAAYTAVDQAEGDKEQAYLVNATGPKNLATAAESVGAALLHISTDYVFSGKSGTPYSETSAVDPCGVYGASKLAGELAVSEVCERHIVLRTSWVFGEFGNNFVKTMMRLSAERDVVSVVDDQYGAPTYSKDIARSLLKIAAAYESVKGGDNAKSFPWGTYHYSGSPFVSWYEFARSIFSAIESKNLFKPAKLLGISTEDYPTIAKRPMSSKLCCKKIKDNFDIDPSDWKKALLSIECYKS